jgi:hypothetical protein
MIQHVLATPRVIVMTFGTRRVAATLVKPQGVVFVSPLYSACLEVHQGLPMVVRAHNGRMVVAHQSLALLHRIVEIIPLVGQVVQETNVLGVLVKECALQSVMHLHKIVQD